MKKFLPYILILVVLVGILSPFKETRAQALGTCTATLNGTVTVRHKTSNGDCPPTVSLGQGGSIIQKWEVYSATNPDPNPSSTEVTVQKISEPKGDDCSLWDGNLIDCVASLFARIAWLIMTIMSWLLWLAGMLLNYVIKETVLTMKEGVDKMTGINIGWKVIRDVMNIGFIFLLVYEGILMIIGQSGKDKIKKFIFSIVLAALLINFSLFFTKVLIDASNVVTIGLYNSMIDSSSKATVPGSVGTTDVTQRPVEGLSAPFMNALSLQKLYGGNSFDNISKAVGGGTNMLIFFLMGAILFLILAFVFFAIAIMFIIRYITLIILLMTSPIAYMGSAIPGMSTYSKQWWESLKGQLLFAPIYMLITMIVLKLIGSEGFIKTEGADWSGLVMGTTTTAVASAGSAASSNSTMSLILNFTVIVGLAIASLVVAKTSATKGSGYIKDATGKLTAFAGGAVLGGTARLQRSTAGRLGNKWANDEDLKTRAAAGDRGAKLQLAIANKAATSSFDVRAVKVGGLSAGSIADFGKVDSKKENFRAEMKEKTDRAKKRVELYKPSDLAVDQAKARLQSDEFKEEERARKEKFEAYYLSPEYKDSEEFKEEARLTKEQEERLVKLKTQQNKVTNSETSLENLRNEMTTSTDEVRKAALKKEIAEAEVEAQKNRAQFRELKVLAEEKAKKLNQIENERNNWMSEEYKDLIATVGGSEKAKKDKVLDEDQAKAVQNIEDAYKTRANSLAEREENASAMWRYAANIVGTPLNALGITSFPKTGSDRQEIARVMRGVPKGKSTQEKAKDLLKEMQKDDESSEDEKKKETPTTPAPTPEPPKTT